MFKHFVFLFTFFHSVFLLHGQITVKGKAVLIETGEPFYSSYPVFLFQKSDKGVLNISTLNFDGEYKINTRKAGKGPFIIYMHTPGYKPFYSDSFENDPDKIRFVDIPVEKETSPTVSVYHTKNAFTRFNADSGFCQTTLFVKLMGIFNDSIKSDFVRNKNGDVVPMPEFPAKKPCVNPSPKEGWDKWMNKQIDQLDKKSRKQILKEKFFMMRLNIGHQKPSVSIESNKNTKVFSKLNEILIRNIQDIIPGEYSYSVMQKNREEILIKVILE